MTFQTSRPITTPGPDTGFLLHQVTARPYLISPGFGTSSLAALYASRFWSDAAVHSQATAVMQPSSTPPGTLFGALGSLTSKCTGALARCAARFKPTPRTPTTPPDLVEIEDDKGNIPLERWAFEELLRMGKLEPKIREQTLHALRMENALRSKHGDYKFGRSYKQILRLLADGCSANPIDAISKVREKKADGSPAKILLIGDGEGALANGLKDHFGDDIEITQISLHPAKPENAGAYKDQIIADAGGLTSLPETDLLFDVFGAAFHSRKQHAVIEMEINSLAIGGMAFMITDSGKIFDLVTSSKRPLFSGTGLMEFGDMSITYSLKRTLPGFHIDLSLTTGGFSRHIYISAERNGPDPFDVESLF
ncbi:MAG: hypothetical protein HN337_07905 [Deltaproteobacteria bacterium]|jgi:hypothetical protein|nr:hypothetical protein [Deltaproteobacteria bacterium]